MVGYRARCKDAQVRRNSDLRPFQTSIGLGAERIESGPWTRLRFLQSTRFADEARTDRLNGYIDDHRPEDKLSGGHTP